MEYATKVSPPKDINQVYLIGKYELLKHLRSKRFYGILAIEFVVIILILALPPLLGEEYRSDPAGFAEDYFQFVWILVVIGATLFAGDSLVSEFQNRTGYLIFPNPVKRESFFLGKFMASIAIMFVVVLIYYAVVSILALAITGGVSSLTLNSIGLALLVVIAASAIGYLISSFMKGSTGALVLTFALLLLIFPIVDGVFQVAAVKPNFSLSFAAGAVQYIMQTPYPTDFVAFFPPDSPDPVFELNMYYPDPAIAAGVMIAYAAVCIILALFLFKRREMAA